MLDGRCQDHMFVFLMDGPNDSVLDHSAANNGTNFFSSARLPGETVAQCVDRSELVVNVGALDIALGEGKE